MKLNLRQLKGLLFVFGVLAFLACLTIAVWLVRQSGGRESTAPTPLSQPNSNKLPVLKPNELGLSDFRPVQGVRLQGHAKVNSATKPLKTTPKPVINIKLLGIFLGDDEDSFGVFQTNGKENVVKLGGTVGDKGPVLTKVASDHVMVKYAQQPARKIELPARKP